MKPRRCYRCGKPTRKHQKVITVSRPAGRWLWWCGCSGEQTEQEPRHQYDCGHCKFAWCCGPLCACIMGPELPPAPRARARQVAQLQADWRRRHK